MPVLVGNWGGGDVWRVTSGEFPSNSYICMADVEGGCVLVDAGLDPLAIDSAMQELKVYPRDVFCTHGHFDHAGSASFFQDKYRSNVYIHGADLKLLKTANFLLMAFKINQRVKLPSDMIFVEDGTAIDVAGSPLIYHLTPGHTEGSCILELEGVLFSGDTIYAKHLGLSDLPGEKPEKLKASIRSFWPKLDDAKFVFPGHGSSVSGKEIKTSNTALLEFLDFDVPEVN